MKRLLVLAVLGLALSSGQATAHGGGKFHLGVGGTVWWKFGPGCYPGGGGGGAGTLGPWYLYWPYEAHFQTPALPQYPYWPGPQTLPGGAPFATPGMFHSPAPY